MKKALLGALGAVGLFAGVAFGAEPSPAADHLDAPLVQMDGRTDINDLYVFQSPTNPDNVVLTMSVNPMAGILSGTEFDPAASYRFLIDHDGDAVQDMVIPISFGPPKPNGEQRVRVRGAIGPAQGDTNEVIDLAGGGRVWTGLADDPFFFDVIGFGDQFLGAGGSRSLCDDLEFDFFEGLDVSAIVLEVPISDLGDDDDILGIWAESRIGSQRIDRIGRPNINTVLIPEAKKDRFNMRAPRRDRTQQTRGMIRQLENFNDDPIYSAALADILLPDLLTVDLGVPTQYPNGRALADDVIDVNVELFTQGAINADCIDGNDVPFDLNFPYLASPNE